MQHRREPLQPHSGIDTWARQRRQSASGIAIELHEHQVPDFDVAIAFGVGRARRAAFNFGAVVVENFAARPARPGIGHLPEVIRHVLRLPRFVADAHAALRRHADFPGPEVVGLVVVDVDRSPEFFFRQLVDLGQQLPRKVNRIALEVVAEAEVAQHLEERMVPRGVAHVLQIVVLAAGAQRLLCSGRARVWPLLPPGKNVLELHHAGIDEQQRRIVRRRQQARSAHDRVALRFKIPQEFFADICAFHDGRRAARPG